MEHSATHHPWFNFLKIPMVTAPAANGHIAVLLETQRIFLVCALFDSSISEEDSSQSGNPNLSSVI